MENKRDFKRYRCKTECEISTHAGVYQGIVVDYSDGLGIITEKTQTLKEGAEADIRMLNSGEEIKAQVVWVKEAGEDIRVGFRRVGNLKGNLRDFKHIDLLMGLQRGTRTGTLEVVSGPVVKKIYIKNGDMIFAASNLIDDRLGERLVKRGRIGVEQFNLATERLLETGEKLGKVLVDMSCMSPHELYQAVRDQVEEIILSIFEIEEGDFEFQEGSLPEENMVTLVISAANIIYRGMKRIKSYNYIKQIFPSPDDILAVSQQPVNIFQSISINDTDKQILHAINRCDPLSKILSRFPDNDFETLKTISAFLSIGIITIEEQGSAREDVSASDILEVQDDDPPEGFLAAVDALYKQCELADYYAFLGIDGNATGDEIQRAYYRVSKRFHPDRHFTFPAYDIKGKLIKIFTYATEANNVLSDAVRREKYDKQLILNIRNTSTEKGVGDASREKTHAVDEGTVQETGVDDGDSALNDLPINNEQEIEEASVAPYEMGIAYMEMGLMAEAIREFRDALNITSKRVQSGKMIAECYIRQGDNRKAMDEMKKLLSETTSDNEEYLDLKYELADTCIKSSEYKDAFTLLDEIRSENPDFRDVATKIETVSSLLSK
jgi:curved DNA-binding protein CbpA